MYGVTVVFQDISERRKAEQRIIYLTHCPLTDLPNRVLFGGRLKQAILNAKRSRTKFALLFVDIDGVEPVSDRYGHAVGDMLLQRISKRMKQRLRESDTVAVTRTTDWRTNAAGQCRPRDVSGQKPWRQCRRADLMAKCPPNCEQGVQESFEGKKVLVYGFR